MCWASWKAVFFQEEGSGTGYFISVYRAESDVVPGACDRGRMVSLFEEGELDDVYIIYTKMENAMQANTEVIKLLPLHRVSFAPKNMPSLAGVYQEGMTCTHQP